MRYNQSFTLSGCLVCLFTCLLATLAVLIVGQTSYSQEITISVIDIEGLTPFQVSFVLSNNLDSQFDQIVGKAVLSDKSGNPIEILPINQFSVGSYTTTTVTVSSRWEFQEVGIYVLQVSLDVGLPSLVAKSLPFRIVPISLPLAPSDFFEGEGLYTVQQQPVNWGISAIEAPKAWHTTHGREDIIIAVIDSGIDTSIPELAQSMWSKTQEIPDNGIDDDQNGYVDDIHGWDFRDNDNDSLTGSKIHWHGTFVAAIIASWPNENGIVGVAPGTKLMDIRFLDSRNQFYQTDWRKFAAAIDYAVQNGANIINLSIYANNKPPSYFESAVNRAVEQGVIVVGIAGNEAASEVSYPGKLPSVIAVSAVDRSNHLASFSNHGREIEIASPGEKITSLFPGGIVGTSSGTSFAAPFVSGTLALILSAHPQMTGPQALSILKGTAIDLGTKGHDWYFGHGLVNAGFAVSR
jgi:subtilisin family serine protease